jgi:BirA family biotin operon repressor/biotin-[acetyl-CoA-carboxylase] ligase
MLPDEARSRLAQATRFADVRWFHELDSTNRYLLDEARHVSGRCVVAVADYQTSGRGRLGRSWSAPPGSSLLVSVLLWPAGLDLAVDDYHLVVSAASLAALSACLATAAIRAGLKWPNDLVVGERKLAGILAEAEGPALVVGIGLNVNWPSDPPDELAGIAVALNQLTGGPVDRADLLVSLLEEFEDRLRQLSRGAEGRVQLMADYRTASATLGQSVRVDVAGGSSITGRADHIDDRGRLLVSVAGADAPVTVTAGDVVHLRGA